MTGVVAAIISNMLVPDSEYRYTSNIPPTDIGHCLGLYTTLQEFAIYLCISYLPQVSGIS